MASEADNDKSLDARMEAIRLKNEELEKKHKEIMEDELIAKNQNAVVNLKQMGKDQSRQNHPYDNIELDFDVKETEKELAKNPDAVKLKNRRPRKEFLDDIPPDPRNFLREDGDEATSRPEQNQRQPNKNPRNNRNRPERQRSNNETSGGDSPPRPRNQNQRPRQQHSPPMEGNLPRKPPQQLRNERRSAPPQTDENSTGHSQQQQNRQRRPNNRSPNKESGDIKNITVQVTNGDVRSVKLKTEKTYGTGRVGHSRQPRDNDDAQKFTVDTFNPNNVDEKSRQQNDQQRNRNPRNNQNRRNQKPKEFQHPTLENMIIPKASVQDRLMKIAKDSEAPSSVDAINTGN